MGAFPSLDFCIGLVASHPTQFLSATFLPSVHPSPLPSLPSSRPPNQVLITKDTKEVVAHTLVTLACINATTGKMQAVPSKAKESLGMGLPV